MAEDILYLGTSVRGITEEVEIPVPWGKVAAKVYGESKNSPVLCIHGWLDNCNSFDGLIPLLPKDKFFVFIDLPGHGHSSKIPPGSFYSYFDFVAMLDRVRNYFAWSYFSLLAHSFGAGLSSVYSATFPERVDKLIILDAIGVVVYEKSEEVYKLRTSIESHMKFEATSHRIPPSYAYEDAKARLLKANQSLDSHSADVLLERGAARKADGTFVFRRDYRHKLRSPVGFDIDSGIEFMSKIEAETMHIIARNGVIHKFLHDDLHTQLVQRLFREGFQLCEYYAAVYISGKHHVHLTDPQDVISYITSMLSRPTRPGLVKSKSIPSKL